MACKLSDRAGGSQSQNRLSQLTVLSALYSMSSSLTVARIALCSPLQTIPWRAGEMAAAHHVGAHFIPAERDEVDWKQLKGL